MICMLFSIAKYANFLLRNKCILFKRWYFVSRTFTNLRGIPNLIHLIGLASHLFQIAISSTNGKTDLETFTH